jgi:HNH endonuclease
MSELPFHICELSPRRLAAFKNFLNASGAEIFSSANAYEVVRFRGGGEMCVIYRNKTGQLKFVGPVRAAWGAFTSHRPWKVAPKASRPVGDKRAAIVATLIERDGRGCFYCAGIILDGLETIEHLLPLTSGGPDHLANSVLAHRRCNEQAGHRSLAEKIRLRDELRRDRPGSAARPADYPTAAHRSIAARDERSSRDG